MSKVFVDANILIEIMLGRPKTIQVSERLRNPMHEYFISTLTVHIVYYFAEASGVDRDFVSKLVAICGHIPVSPATVAVASQRYRGKDFEDCLQAAAAELAGCKEILTLDKSFKSVSGTKLKVHVL